MSGRAKLSEPQAFVDHRDAALALLSLAIQRDRELPHKTASFLGACAGTADITPRMRWWLDKLLRADRLPPIKAPLP